MEKKGSSVMKDIGKLKVFGTILGGVVLLLCLFKVNGKVVVVPRDGNVKEDSETKEIVGNLYEITLENFDFSLLNLQRYKSENEVLEFYQDKNCYYRNNDKKADTCIYTFSGNDCLIEGVFVNGEEFSFDGVFLDEEKYFKVGDKTFVNALLDNKKAYFDATTRYMYDLKGNRIDDIGKSINLKKYAIKNISLEKLKEEMEKSSFVGSKLLEDISMDYFKKLVDKDSYSLVYIGRPTCKYCVMYEELLDSFLPKYNVFMKRLLTNELSLEEENFLKKFIEENTTIEGIRTPLTLIVGQGKVKDYLLGYKEEDVLKAFLDENDFLE